MPVFWSAVLWASLVAAVATAPAQGAECLCDNLPALQAELRNAQRLQAAFREHIAVLRGMGNGESQAALQQFAGNRARSGLEPIPGYNGPSEFDYVAQGQNVDPSRFDAFTADQLCAMSASAAQRLEQAMQATACDGIAEALRAHENMHGQFCRRIGYRNYLGMHGADRAQEEAEAYGAQITALRSAIAHVLDRANVRVEYDLSMRFDGYKPLFWMTTQSRGELPQHATLVGEMIRLEGEGPETTNISIEGDCTFPSGRSLASTLTRRVGGDTDGLTLRIRYNEQVSKTNGTTLQCRFRTANGGEIIVPTPFPALMGLERITNIELPLRDGAEQPIEIVAMRGFTGHGRIRLVLQCISGR